MAVAAAKAAPTGKVNINSASAEQLTTLRGPALVEVPMELLVLLSWILSANRLIGRGRMRLATAIRASRRELEADVPAEPTTKRRCSPNRARLISKVYHADPLVCRQCGRN